MKKIIAIFLMCISSLFGNEQILQAIKDSDVAQLQTLLKDVSLTAQEKLSYVDIAHEIICTLRSKLELEQIRPTPNGQIILGYFSIIVGLGIGMICGIEALISKVNKPLFLMTTLSLAPGGFLIYKGLKHYIVYLKNLKQQYDDSLTIKHMIYTH